MAVVGGDLGHGLARHGLLGRLPEVHGQQPTAPRAGPLDRDRCLALAVSGSAQLGQGPAQVADALGDPLLVLDQGEAHVAVATRPEADAR